MTFQRTWILEADGENVGIVKFGASGAKLLVEYMDQLIASRRSIKDWAPRAFLEFARHHPLLALSTRGLPWIEIDFPEDYQRAVTEVFPRIDGAQEGFFRAKAQGRKGRISSGSGLALHRSAVYPSFR